jgi:hypothetical protein
LVKGKWDRVETRLVVGRVSFCPEINLHKWLNINDLRAPRAPKALTISELQLGTEIEWRNPGPGMALAHTENKNE